MTENSKEKVGGTQMLRSVYFELGRELVTPGIYGAMKASNKFTSEIIHAMQLFCLGNWGKVSVEDKEMNDLALKDGGRLMGTYRTCKGKVWIITEADRSVTTVLFPREY